MANNLYGKGREKFAQALINWNTDTIKCVLVDTGAYTADLVGDEFLSNINISARISTSVAFTGKTSTQGACDANDITFTAVSGVNCEALVIYKDTGDPATSPLLVYIDTATGLPILPNGGDILVGWNNGSDKIFKL